MTLLFMVQLVGYSACIGPASATGKRDIDAGLRTLPLLINKITGDVTMAVLYDPDNSQSREDADAIKKEVDAGIILPNGAKVSALLVSVNELGKLARAQIAFVTPGLSGHFSDISIAASAASLLTITTDLSCVSAGKCIIGIATEPNMSIYYSKSAANAAKIEFSQAFALLVKEL